MESQLSAGNIIAMVFGLAMVVLIFASLWNIFAKAGKPGWAARKVSLAFFPRFSCQLI